MEVVIAQTVPGKLVHVGGFHQTAKTAQMAETGIILYSPFSCS
ncbi:MAG: hypothetical protein WBM69_19655 [Desulfobacterales bacterium]